MKYLYIGLLILCLLLCACYLSTRQIDHRTEAMVLPLHQALQAFRAGDVTAGTRFVAETNAQWARNEAFFASLLSHEKTAQVSEDLRLLSLGHPEEFEKTCIRLIDNLEKIRHMDLPVPENIL